VAAVTCCCVVLVLALESATAAFAGSETALYACAVLESAAALAAGCRSAALARGRSLEFGLACLAARAGVAAFDSSAQVAVAIRKYSYSGIAGDLRLRLDTLGLGEDEQRRNLAARSDGAQESPRRVLGMHLVRLRVRGSATQCMSSRGRSWVLNVRLG
jgi:hypothetical protein